jgi:hypothetical protein
MSPETLLFLYEMLRRQVVEVGADDFAAVTATALKAKEELLAAIAKSEVNIKNSPASKHK